MQNPVRERAFNIVKKAEQVKINEGKIKELAKSWKIFSVPAWPEDFHFKSLDYFFILDSINFCFWSLEGEKWSINYKGKRCDGYFGLSLALRKFFEDSPEKANLDYFSTISQEEFNLILQGGHNLQFLDERWHIAKEVAKEAKDFLIDKRLSDLVPKIARLPYFDDPFLKRAQILACDIYGAGLVDFEDLDYLTAFADYKVPQILNHFGILEYSESLDKKIKGKVLIKQDSQEETEIRAATIWAVELLRKEFNDKFYSFEIDWILWNQAQNIQILKPYHLTRTIRY